MSIENFKQKHPIMQDIENLRSTPKDVVIALQKIEQEGLNTVNDETVAVAVVRNIISVLKDNFCHSFILQEVQKKSVKMTDFFPRTIKEVLYNQKKRLMRHLMMTSLYMLP